MRSHLEFVRSRDRSGQPGSSVSYKPSLRPVLLLHNWPQRSNNHFDRNNIEEQVLQIILSMTKELVYDHNQLNCQLYSVVYVAIKVVVTRALVVLYLCVGIMLHIVWVRPLCTMQNKLFAYIVLTKQFSHDPFPGIHLRASM